MRVLAIIWKEMLHIERDIRILYFSLIWPVVLLLIFGFTVSLDVKNIRLVYYDLDGRPESRELLYLLRAAGLFHLDYRKDFSWDASRSLLKRNQAKGIMIIPVDFARRLDRSEESPFQLLVDGSDNNTARITLGYILSITQNFYQQNLKQRLSRWGSNSGSLSPPVSSSLRFLYNPTLRSQNYIVPGLIALIMMIIGTLLTSLALSVEWERGTMEQLFYTPIKPIELIVGKITPYFIIGIFQITLVLLTGIVIFKVPFHGSILLFYLGSTLFLLGTLTLGLFLSLISKTQQVAAMLAFLVAFVPTYFLSGFIFPVASMPIILQAFSHVVPATYFLNIIRGTFLKASGLLNIWPDFLAMFFFASFFVFISIVSFKKRIG